MNENIETRMFRAIDKIMNDKNIFSDYKFKPIKIIYNFFNVLYDEYTNLDTLKEIFGDFTIYKAHDCLYSFSFIYHAGLLETCFDTETKTIDFYLTDSDAEKLNLITFDTDDLKYTDILDDLAEIYEKTESVKNFDKNRFFDKFIKNLSPRHCRVYTLYFDKETGFYTSAYASDTLYWAEENLKLCSNDETYISYDLKESSYLKYHNYEL